MIQDAGRRFEANIDKPSLFVSVHEADQIAGGM
jgi:hypothetical protein